MSGIRQQLKVILTIHSIHFFFKKKAFLAFICLFILIFDVIFFLQFCDIKLTVKFNYSYQFKYSLKILHIFFYWNLLCSNSSVNVFFLFEHAKSIWKIRKIENRVRRLKYKTTLSVWITRRNEYNDCYAATTPNWC